MNHATEQRELFEADQDVNKGMTVAHSGTENGEAPALPPAAERRETASATQSAHVSETAACTPQAEQEAATPRRIPVTTSACTLGGDLKGPPALERVQGRLARYRIVDGELVVQAKDTEFALPLWITPVAQIETPDGSITALRAKATDRGGASQVIDMPYSTLLRGTQFAKFLTERGIECRSVGRDLDFVADYLYCMRPDQRIRKFGLHGWNGALDCDCEVYLAANRTYGETPWGLTYELAAPLVAPHGDPEQLPLWDKVAKSVVGNPVPMTAICAALSSLVLRQLELPSFGLYFISANCADTGGLSTVIGLADAVISSEPSAMEYAQVAQDVAGALRARNDSLLVVSGLADCDDPRRRKAVVTQLLAGVSKERRPRADEPTDACRLAILAHGSEDPQTWVGKTSGNDALAGRLFVLPVSDEFPIINHPHRFGNPTALLEHVGENCWDGAGSLGAAFLNELAKDTDCGRQAVRRLHVELRTGYAGALGSEELVEVERRGLDYFAAMAAAGYYAVKAGLLPWPDCLVYQALLHCFKQWLRQSRRRRARAGRPALERLLEGIRVKREERMVKPLTTWREYGLDSGVLFTRSSPEQNRRQLLIPRTALDHILPAAERRPVLQLLLEYNAIDRGSGNHLRMQIRLPGDGQQRATFLVLWEDALDRLAQLR